MVSCRRNETNSKDPRSCARRRTTVDHRARLVQEMCSLCNSAGRLLVFLATAANSSRSVGRRRSRRGCPSPDPRPRAIHACLHIEPKPKPNLFSGYLMARLFLFPVEALGEGLKPALHFGAKPPGCFCRQEGGCTPGLGVGAALRLGHLRGNAAATERRAAMVSAHRVRTGRRGGGRRRKKFKDRTQRQTMTQPKYSATWFQGLDIERPCPTRAGRLT